MPLETTNTETNDDDIVTDYELQREQERKARVAEDQREHIKHCVRKVFDSLMPSLGVKDHSALWYAMGGMTWVENNCDVSPSDGSICALSGGKWVPLREAFASHPVVQDWMRNQGSGGNIPLPAKELELEKLTEENQKLAALGVSQNWVVNKRVEIQRRIKQLQAEIYNEKMSKAMPDSLPQHVPQELQNELQQVQQDIAAVKAQINGGPPPDHLLIKLSGLNKRKHQLQQQIANY